MNEFKRYCKPFLRRRTFRFSRLDGLIRENDMRKLRLGMMFAGNGSDFPRFRRELDCFGGNMRKPIVDEMKRLVRMDVIRTEDDREEAIRRMQQVFIDNGVFTDFGRPASVGLILENREILGVDTYLVLGQSLSDNVHSGRLALDGRGKTIMVNVTNAAGRLIELLDIMFSYSDRSMQSEAAVRTVMGRLDLSLLEAETTIMDICALRKIMRKDDEWLKRFAGMDFAREELPVISILDIIAARAGIARIKAAAEKCETPEELMLRLINEYVSEKLAHEMCHLIERKSNGRNILSPKNAELLTYMMEAAHARADIAFSSMIARADSPDSRGGVDIMADFPALVEDLRDRNDSSIALGSDYLRERALAFVQDVFEKLRLLGSATPEFSPVAKLHRREYLGKEHLPLLEKAICNPTTI